MSFALLMMEFPLVPVSHMIISKGGSGDSHGGGGKQPPRMAELEMHLRKQLDNVSLRFDLSVRQIFNSFSKTD